MTFPLTRSDASALREIARKSDPCSFQRPTAQDARTLYRISNAILAIHAAAPEEHVTEMTMGGTVYCSCGESWQVATPCD